MQEQDARFQKGMPTNIKKVVEVKGFLFANGADTAEVAEEMKQARIAIQLAHRHMVKALAFSLDVLEDTPPFVQLEIALGMKKKDAGDDGSN